MEYFRSKDFVELLKKHPGLMAGVLAEDQIAVEESRASMAAALLLRGLIVRCDRAVKTIRQGRKKLSKWPAKLAVHSVRQTTCHPLYSVSRMTYTRCTLCVLEAHSWFSFLQILKQCFQVEGDEGVIGVNSDL